MKSKLQSNQKGFTIIEVLIVLAIAGLILLIVFLAVPALQRNSRNTQRASDAAQIAGLINECLSNRNGVVTSCDSPGEITGFDTNKMALLKSLTYTAPPTAAAGGLIANFGFNSMCSPDGSSVVAATNARQFAIAYFAETATGPTLFRCVDS